MFSLCGQCVVEAGILENNAESAADFIRQFLGIQSINFDPAACWLQQWREHCDRGRFARAARPWKRHELTRSDFKCNVVDGGEVTEGLGQMVNLDHGAVFIGPTRDTVGTYSSI